MSIVINNLDYIFGFKAWGIGCDISIDDYRNRILSITIAAQILSASGQHTSNQLARFFANHADNRPMRDHAAALEWSNQIIRHNIAAMCECVILRQDVAAVSECWPVYSTTATAWYRNTTGCWWAAE